MRHSIIGLLIFFSLRAYAQKEFEIIRDYVQNNDVKIIEDFKSLLSIPNVAYDLKNIHLNANHIEKELEKRGVEAQQLRMIGAPPIVYGHLPVKGAKRTIALYVHYDGQPVDKTKWENDPWQPVLYDKAIDQGGRIIDWPTANGKLDPENRIYARSAGDDKAPIISILTALDAIQANQLQLTSNLVFFFEGQEEAGSPQLLKYLEDNRKLLDKIDIWLFCDGPVHQSRKPQLVFGVRGSTGMEITVYGPNRPLHSGHYGNWAPVPGQMLASLVASMKDDRGNVIIEGYYDDVVPLTASEESSLKNIPDYDGELMKELGLMWTEGEGSLAERILLPSLTVQGFSTGNVGELARNVVPSDATVNLGMRLVKGCEPSKMQDRVEAHIQKQGYYIVRETPDLQTRLKYPKIAKVTREGGYIASRTSMDDPYAKMIIDRTKELVGDDLILLPSLGGSLPLYLFTDVLKKPALIVPIANHDNNQHAANENIRIANLWYGIELMGALMTMPN